MERARCTRRRRWARASLAAAALVVAVARHARAGDTSVFSPASRSALEIRDLFALVIAITGAIAVVVGGFLLYCIVRFRAPRGARPVEPPQLYGSGPIEVAWTVGPILIVFVLFLVVVRTVFEVRAAPPAEEGLAVRIVGHQWWWEFEYADAGVRTANELHLPVSDGGEEHVALALDSADVVHSFWVPRLAGKTDLLPGRTNTMWFAPEQIGVFEGQCAEYCGTQHANMLLRVVVHSRSDFDRWLVEQSRPAADHPFHDPGKQVFLTKTCVNCHTIRGTGARGTFGPDLTHFGSRATLGAGVAPNDRATLTAWLDDPQLLKPGCNMPDLQLTPEEVSVLAGYLESLK